MIETVDRNGDGRISYSEFRSSGQEDRQGCRARQVGGKVGGKEGGKQVRGRREFKGRNEGRMGEGGRH